MLSFTFSPPSVPTPNRILTLAFLFPDASDKETLNKVVAWISTHKTCHVEMVFEDDMAFSIFAGSNLYFKRRSFSNPEYSLISLSIPHSEYNSLYKYCQSAVTHNLGFTDIGMVLSVIQPTHCPFYNAAPSVDIGYTFCSKIITEALQFAGTLEVEHFAPCTTTPSCLYGVFKDSNRRIISSVSYKRGQLRQMGVVK